ncbi:MAG: hypothetical protein ACFFD4_25760 [Candidatus Odinarchaeota archaeon]
MEKRKSDNITNLELYDLLLEIQQTVSDIAAKLVIFDSRIEVIEDQLVKKARDKYSYLNETVDAIQTLMSENGGFPVSRDALASSMALSDSTVYVHCEKLVKLGKVNKFYGRDLALEPAKAVYYAVPVSLYDMDTLEQVVHLSARKIALALVEAQPLTEKDFIAARALTEDELKEGLTYLLNRGLIKKTTNQDGLVEFSITQ